MFRSGRRGWRFGETTTRRYVRSLTKHTFITFNPLLQVAETYTTALSTVSPRRATANFHRLYINFAKFYEEGGTTGEAEKDIDSARKILLKATKVNFKTVDELAEVWCEWAEMEIRQE